MKFLTVAFLTLQLLFPTVASQKPIEEALASRTSSQSPDSRITPYLELREIVVDQAGQTIQATQYPTVTTGWFASELSDGVTTWIPVTYTQTFPTTPPGSGHGTTGIPSGSIGLCKTACDAKQAGAAGGSGVVVSIRVRGAVLALGVVAAVMCLA